MSFRMWTIREAILPETVQLNRDPHSTIDGNRLHLICKKYKQWLSFLLHTNGDIKKKDAIAQWKYRVLEMRCKFQDTWGFCEKDWEMCPVREEIKTIIKWKP